MKNLIQRSFKLMALWRNTRDVDKTEGLGLLCLQIFNNPKTAKYFLL